MLFVYEDRAVRYNNSESGLPGTNMTEGEQMARARGDVYDGAPTPPNEVNLIDIWTMLARQKRWAIAALVVTLLAAITYVVGTPAIYESRSVVRIGRSAGELVVSAKALVLTLNEDYRVDELDRTYPRLVSVKDEGEDAIVLRAEAKSAAEAKQFLAQIVQKILDGQSTHYQHVRNTREADLKALDDRIEAMDKHIARLSTATNMRVDEAVKALLVLQSGSLLTASLSLLEQRMKVQQQLFTFNTYPAQLLRDPSLSIKPIRPRPVLTISAAVLLGTVFAIIAAFLADFTDKLRRRDDEATVR